MKVWQINTSEATPADADGHRLRRSGMLAQTLVDRGHDLLWWSADYYHFTKKHRYGQDLTIDLQDRYQIHFLHGPGYKRNVSWARLKDHRIIAEKFAREARQQDERPELIICSYPTLDTCCAAIEYGQEFDIPVVIDIRDLWPDVFLEAAPKWGRPLARLLLSRYYAMSRKICRDATAIVGNSGAFVQWGLCVGKRNQTKLDRDFPFGYQEPVLTEPQRKDLDIFWKSQGINPENHPPIICFFGTLGQQFELDTVIDAAQQFLKQGDATFVFCGDGARRESLMQKTSEEERIMFPGWVTAAQIWRLMEMSSIALAPYNDNKNFQLNLPNKPLEYMAGSLPILTSLSQGGLVELLEQHQCGSSYGRDARLLAREISELLDKRQLGEQWGANARALFEEHFEAGRVYQRFVDHLERVAAGDM